MGTGLGWQNPAGLYPLPSLAVIVTLSAAAPAGVALAVISAAVTVVALTAVASVVAAAAAVALVVTVAAAPLLGGVGGVCLIRGDPDSSDPPSSARSMKR